MNVSACLVTRGDISLRPVLKSLPYHSVVIWNNANTPADMRVFGRYLAANNANRPIIYTQDDDVIIDNFAELEANYEPGKIIANMRPGHREGEGFAWVGHGALFDRDLPGIAFRKYLARYPFDEVFLRYCDVVFGALTPFVRINHTVTDLPHSTADYRMYNQPNHYEEINLLLERCRQIIMMENKGD